MKKLSIIFLSLILCITLFGCSANKADIDENQLTESTITTVSTTQSESTIHEKSKSEKTDSTTTSSSQSSKTTTTSKQKNSDNKNADNTDRTTAANKNTTVNNQASKPEAKKPITTAKQTTTSSTITCTVTIECTSLLDNMDNLKAGHEEYVPSDGYILSSCSVTLPNDSTAYDAVKTACENQGITMNVVSSGYGRYIAGFNNIDEKDCGNQSGWIYFVNGKSPSKSCNKYTLSNGDSVVFSYTC